MSLSFEPAEYLRLPIFDVATGIGIASGLLAAAPKPPPPSVKRALEELRRATREMKEAWHRIAEEKKDLRRPADVAIDRLWSAVHDRLAAWDALPTERHSLAARAAELRGKLFPEGLSFLQLPYLAEWAESDKRLAQVDAEGAGRDLERLVGAEFFAELKKAHGHYGDVLGMKHGLPAAPAAPLLAEPLKALRRAMSSYTLKLLSLVEPDDDGSLEMVRAALAPIDAHRAATARRGATGRAPEPDVELPSELGDAEGAPSDA